MDRFEEGRGGEVAGLLSGFPPRKLAGIMSGPRAGTFVRYLVATGGQLW